MVSPLTSMTPESVDDLIRWVEAATGPDRELDAEIMFDLFAKPVGKRDEDGGPSGYLWPEDNASWSFGLRFPGKDKAWFTGRPRDETLLIWRDDAWVLINSLRVLTGRPRDETLLIWRDDAWVLMNSLRVPTLTASIDVALALVEKVLPGWNFSVGDDGFADLGPCWARLFPKFQNHGTGNCYATTPPLAILLALLRALRSTA